MKLAESGWDEAVILDVAHLSGFTGGDPDFESHILGIFVDNAPGYLQALASIEEDGWKTTAHKLKGAARSIGAWNLARAAERAEKMPSPAVDAVGRHQILKILNDRMKNLLLFVENHKKQLLAKPL